MDDDLGAELDATMASLRAAGLPEGTPPGDYSHDGLALAWGASLADTARYVDLWGQSRECPRLPGLIA